MFLLDGELICSASDLTAAIGCEFALLRGLDVRLGRIDQPEKSCDAMLARTARLGDAHEGRELDDLLTRYGPYDAAAGRGVYAVARPASRQRAALAAAAAETLAVLRSGTDVVYQAAFFRGRFSGYADFLIRDSTEEAGGPRYSVYDTKLARHARVSALLQLAAYADELATSGIATAPHVHLLLGDGSTADYELADLIPVYRERRARLHHLLDEHRLATQAVAWNDDRYVACGRCDTCAAEVAAHRDLLLVAGMRTSQRTRLREAGVTTIDELATHSRAVDGMRAGTRTTLCAQAALQVRQNPPGADDGSAASVAFDVYAPDSLGALPPPDPGDIFFDFEGDPLWSDGDPTISGLEYLFGVVETPDTPDSTPAFRPFWAHDRAGEKQALVDFLAYVADRRAAHPGMHVYHYAAYEKSALLRLAGRYGVGEDAVDDLLRAGVLIDLYAVVRNSIRVSQPSYSLKKLEPLYMGEQLRDSEVTTAGDSIVAYADYCELRDNGDTVAAQAQLREIADYNEYDCLSTYRLRDWLLARATEHGVAAASGIAPTTMDSEAPDDARTVELGLLGCVADVARTDRTDAQQAVAVLAAALGYHRREAKPVWWAHFDRLTNPVDDWADTTDVLVVDEGGVVGDWGTEGRQRNPRRTIRLAGRLAVGSRLSPGTPVSLLYDADTCPPGLDDGSARRGVNWDAVITEIHLSEDGLDEFIVVETHKAADPDYATLPMAVAPGQPINTKNLRTAIERLATQVAARLESGATPAAATCGQAALDLLARRPPALRALPTLPAATAAIDGPIRAISAAVRDLERSYLAVQGPPGSGKTYVGARVIAGLVAEGWQIGVVAQSHKVIEHLLDQIIRAGVDPCHVGKKTDSDNTTGGWTGIGGNGHSTWLADRAGRGCVLGGTAWDFTNPKRVEPGSLDLLVIDEAGQFSLANTLAVSTAARRLLLLGDPQQLPQVSQGTHPERCDESALSWITEGHHVLPPERGYFLDRSWRMHPALCAAVSRLSYDDKLQSHEPVTAVRALDGIRPGIQVVAVDHAGNSVESREEADEVTRQIEDLLGRHWLDPADSSAPRPLGQDDILVVAPYNAQVAMIRHGLAAASLGAVRVGTVDKFQGQQAPVVIVSMTASAAEDVPRGMSFLLSRNRVNVAISRGQWCAVVIRSPRLTDYLPTSPTDLAVLGGFIGLCDG